MTRKKNTKKKVEIVFDPKKRREFLTGFQKRKNERRTRAKAELDRNLKEERKRIRQEIKDGFKHLKKSFEPLRELTEEDKADNELEEKTYEDDEVQVKIVELSSNDLTAQRNMLGANLAEESEEEQLSSNSDNEQKMQQTNCIPGMDFDMNARKSKKTNEEDEGSEDGEPSEFKSKKDLDRLMKTKTLKKMKKSKIFKMKERMDTKTNRKKINRDRRKTIRSVPKHLRKKLKNGPAQTSRYRKGRMVNKKELRRKRTD